MQIYLDYSATTPPCGAAIDGLQSVLRDQWGNPSSLHHWGQRSALILETARQQVATLVGAEPTEIVFTAGGTEADNLAILGIAQGYDQPQHLIVSAVEHSAVAEPARWLESQGWQVTWLGVDGLGRVNPSDLQGAIQPNTALISVIYGQSEVGTVQPIAELGAIARSAGVPFHTDAVQVAGRLPLDLQTLPVDLLSLSSHKIYGPQGAGALYVRSGLTLQPGLRGGGQERGLRSGTQAVATLAGFGAAAAVAAVGLSGEQGRLAALRDRLFQLLADEPSLRPTGDRHHRLPHHVSFCWHSPDPPRLTGKTLVHHLNLAGIGISAGSACNSGKTMASPVLLAMGYDSVHALGGIRLTLGSSTTAADIDWTALVLRQVIHRLSQW
ncbi:cysteine desulfurase family protein [Prochlorothrix hollandica]|uniref:cysteine desulfurase n=1 Tax=Prochlorothrix hollandica PCC 9006 = CALU 1027 TaxID=317619 RepID=A0A0M2PNW2_PROHO|nr:cysteine desulfurase family protein [Prochlorothrix hollandica]KKI98300.1 cysteine desulfurase [Prochlorothrix hollandica PCC 9006 = CALU 1027]